jgi:ferric-dicitrate binding protein FerR (iron transport regulator)
MKKTNLDKLLDRYVTGRVTEAERKKIEAWLDVKKTEEGKDMVLDEADEERLFRKITSDMDNVREIQSFRPSVGLNHPIFKKTWLRIAATILLLMACTYTIRLIMLKDKSPAVFVATNNIEREILADGSIVWLHKSSELTFVESADGKRLATLRGEGLFEVAKDPTRPFVISCGDAKVRVVGTSFNLKSDEAGIELKVLTGKVHVSTISDATGVEVIPNETAVFRPEVGLKKRTMDEREVKAVTANTEYDMAFKNTALKTVILRIERKFSVEVILENSEMNHCHITADLTDHSLDGTMEMLRELLDIEYSLEKNTVTIRGKGCN